MVFSLIWLFVSSCKFLLASGFFSGGSDLTVTIIDAGLFGCATVVVAARSIIFFALC